jgi:hypothetical protein
MGMYVSPRTSHHEQAFSTNFNLSLSVKLDPTLGLERASPSSIGRLSCLF